MVKSRGGDRIWLLLSGALHYLEAFPSYIGHERMTFPLLLRILFDSRLLFFFSITGFLLNMLDFYS